MSQDQAPPATEELYDEVVEEWDVTIGTELSHFLHLCPLPSASLAAKFNTSPLSLRFKPQARRLEATTAVAEENPTTAKIVGAGWPWRTVQHFVAKFTSAAAGDGGRGRWHWTPCTSVIPLTAGLGHLDEANFRERETAKAYASNNTPNHPHPSAGTPPAPAPKVIQVQFRKKETEEQVQARLSSYAHLQRLVDDEPWLSFNQFFPLTSLETDAVRGKLLVPPAVTTAIEFASNEDYLHKILETLQ